MAQVKFAKVVSALPDPLEANTLYAVRVGDGFDLYATNSGGTIVAYRAGASERKRVTVLPFHNDAGANATFTNQANAEQYLANSARNESYFDAEGFTECRLVANVVASSVSVNTPRIYPQYNLGAGWVTIGDGSIVSGQALSLAAPTGVKRGVWMAVPVAARTDVRWRIAMNGGDGVADPALGMTALQFR